jgi:hypothetical protein
MPEDFGKMGYGYFALLCREMDKEDIRHHYPAAAIQATLCEIKRDREKRAEPFTPWDFIPGWQLKKEDTQRPMTSEEMSVYLGAVKPWQVTKRT